MKVKRHTVWSTKEINLKDEFQRRWYIQQVLIHGRAKDIEELNWEEINEILPFLNLPIEIRKLWENYFNVN